MQVAARPSHTPTLAPNGRVDTAAEYVIETRELAKRYGARIMAVNGLNLRVRRGEVYGFLGPNGSGKTTTLRMLLGLARPSAGSASVLGAAPGTPQGLARIGAMIETPAFYPYLSGRDNLTVMARHAGAPLARIPAVLEEVELTERAGQRFSAYSLGMKQRLGVAAALLKDPDLLILDEPTNGLDPAGMAEMRDFIRNLGQGHRTVLLSSHLMTEIEQICDRVGVIRAGKLVAEGTVSELRSRFGRDSLRVRAEPLEAAERLLATLPGVTRVTRDHDLLRVFAEPALTPEIARALVGAGLDMQELARESASLEHVFLELTQGQEHAQHLEEGAHA
jgi:ABC-type multidrug transport system ATPase subunit